jgi:hypothetical protein
MQKYGQKMKIAVPHAETTINCKNISFVTAKFHA